MVELADTQDLGSCAERCTGSTPATRTKKKVALAAFSFVFPLCYVSVFFLIDFRLVYVYSRFFR